MQKNRTAVASIYGASDIVTLKQVHGVGILNASEEHLTSSEIEADGIITNQHGLVLAIQTADCVPVLIASYDGTVIGALHCGWRSSRAGIIEKVVKQINELFSVPASNLQAIIGPAIQQASYEVDLEFYKDFLTEAADNERYFKSTNKEDKFLFNLPVYIASKLTEQGVAIHTDVMEDTYSNPQKYPSRRRSFHKNEQYRGSILSTIAITG